MLQGLRDKAQGWISWTIILVICFIFALWGIEHYLTGNNSNEYAAKVNGVAITKAQLNSEYERIKRQRQMQSNLATSQEDANRLKQQVLQQLVTAQTLLQAAKQNGFRVTQSQIDGALSSIPAFSENNSFSAQKFNQILQNVGYSPSEFIGLLTGDILINQAQIGITASAFALPEEINNALRLTEQKRSIAYAIIPVQQYLHPQTITEAMALAYYNANPQAFKTTEQVKIDYLKLSLDEIKAHITINKSELEQYYKANIENFTSPTQWQVAHILVVVPSSASNKEITLKKNKINELASQLQQNVDFAKLAAKSSEDAATAKTGGVMPWFSAGSLKDDMYQKTAQVLKPGAISNPIKTSKGFEIIKLIAIKPGKIQSFEQAEPQIKKLLLQQKAQQIFSSKSDKLANLTYSNPDSLQAAAAALDLKVESSDFFTRQGSKTGIAANPKVVAAAFDVDVLTHKNNSPVIELNPDIVMVLRVAQFQPVETLSFAKVKSQIIEKLALEQAKKKAQSVGEELIQQLKAGKITAAQLAKQHISWHNIDKMSRNDIKVNPDVLQLVFSLPKPVEKNISIGGHRLTLGDYAIVKLFSVYDGKTDLDSEQRQAFVEQLANSFGQLDYNAYIKVQLKNAKIVYDTHVDAAPMNTASMDD